MSKTINFELSKRLNDLWLLDDIETEYWYNKHWYLNEYIWKTCDIPPENSYDSEWHTYCDCCKRDLERCLNYSRDKYDKISKWLPYKTLTLEEVIEFLPQSIKNYTLEIYKCINWNFNIVYVNNQTKEDIIVDRLCMFHWPLIWAIEKMIEYLLDNNLLWKKKEENT